MSPVLSVIGIVTISKVISIVVVSKYAIFLTKLLLAKIFFSKIQFIPGPNVIKLFTAVSYEVS
jgi:hypothetical protein